MKEKNNNPWTIKDEKEHFPSGREWWCSEAFFTTIEDNKKWGFKNGFTQWVDNPNKIGSNYSQTLFDLKKNVFYRHYSSNRSGKLKTGEKKLDIRFEDSYIKGLFPDYTTHVFDKTNNIELKINYHCISNPHWIAQDITNGWLPLGLGFFRYGFIPKIHLDGILKIKNKKFNITGTGYFEHAWGDFSFINPLSNSTKIKKTFTYFRKLLRWWKDNHNLSFPRSLSFSSENNPFGYDWFWAITDNGWTLFFGNIRFWLVEGPVMGTLILTKDGKNYTDFCDIKFKYNNVKHSKIFDFYYPTDLNISAKKGKEKIILNCQSLTKTMEGPTPSKSGKIWRGFVITEVPCKIEGYYLNDDKKTKIRGNAKMESHRLVSFLGHSSLKLNFLLPPDGFGLSSEYVSNYFEKNIKFDFKLAPKPKLRFNMKKIKREIQ